MLALMCYILFAAADMMSKRVAIVFFIVNKQRRRKEGSLLRRCRAISVTTKSYHCSTADESVPPYFGLSLQNKN